MKITKIEVCDFRAFQGPAVYDFAFEGEQNLFVYGENGSGKSSLFRAIQEFFNRNRDAKPFSSYKNVDSPPSDAGRVTVEFDNGSTQVWANEATRPLRNAPASHTALQAGCLDYRSLLETNFSQKGERVNLFEIAVRHLVPNHRVSLGGYAPTIGQLWSAVQKPKGHYKNRLISCHAAVAAFNAGFEPVVTPLITKASELLIRFPGWQITLGASFPGVEYKESVREFINRDLILNVYQNGSLVERHHDFLNEARLSAIGLVIYLAGLLISVPTVSEYPKLLVLDDVLVGLDMENRAPVLQVLKDFFPDWQIILLTYDKVWYEMVQVAMTPDSGWRAYELWVGPGQRPLHRPREGGPDFFVIKAQEHLANNDHHAAANYARMAFEARIKNYCDKKSLPVPYKKDPKNLKAEEFWKAAKLKAIADAANAAPLKARLEARFHAIDVAKKIVMNPLSHEAVTTVTSAEIQAAITAVQNLQFA